MSLQDLMSDFVARVNNAVMADNSSVVVLKNNLVIQVCKKLVTLGYFEGFKINDRDILVDLNLNRINKIKRISKPGQRQYHSYKTLPKIINGVGFNILSTSAGVLTNAEAKKTTTGGELLFSIY
jgi:small subunit ribosomal protein S8